MVKSIITTVCAILILACGAAYEQHYVFRAFDDLKEQAEIMIDKELSKTATYEDASFVRNRWMREKRKMCAFVSHNDIKELDMWLSEGVAFTKEKNFDEAATKYIVIANLCESIPRGYLIKFENIF